MTDQELREKIVKALEQGAKNFHEYFHEEFKEAFRNGAMHFGNKDCKKTIYDFFADALIAAGIGDVKEAEKKYRNAMLMAIKSQTISSERSRYMELNKNIAEHRAVVAERAFEKATELAYEYRTEYDTLSCSSCPMFHIFDRCKERGLYEDCSKRWKEELIKQAEKELAEERKDD